MSQTIKTYADLCEERERIKNLLVVQRQKVKDDWEELKEEFLPVKNAFGVVGKITHADKSNPLINAGLKVASDLFLKNFVLAKAGWVTKLAVPFVVKNYSSHLIAERGGNFLGRVFNFFTKNRTRRKNYSYMNDKDNKVVNTEEQNRAVNPGTGDYQEMSPKEHVGTNQALTEENTKEDKKRNKPDKNTRAEE
jgi:hypothetical protein